MAVASWKENNDMVHKLHKAQASLEAGRGNASAVQGYESAQNPPPKLGENPTLLGFSSNSSRTTPVTTFLQSKTF